MILTIMLENVHIDKKTFKQIFKDWWPLYKKVCPVRKVEGEVIEKAMKCGETEIGYTQYLCPKCGEIKKVPFSCHTRFCLSCAKVHLDTWVRKIKATMFAGITHRHIVLTVPKQLWNYFQYNRDLFKVLADTGSELIKDMLRFYRKEKGIEPGILSVTQSSGRAANFNLHLHLLITEGDLADDGVWYNLIYLEQTLLGKKWQYFLLTALRKHLPKTEKVKSLIDFLFRKENFITYAKKEKVRKRDIVNYLIKYVASPPITLKRILKYDGRNVTYRYQSREGKKGERKLSALSFIHLLTQHIHKKGQKMIRYYGLLCQEQSF